MLHLGPVGAGRRVALNDQLRQEFAAKLGRTEREIEGGDSKSQIEA